MARIMSERSFRWLLNLYPPMLFHRVRIVEFGAGFRSCQVQVRRSLLTRNLNGTTFGGAIFTGFDPIYALLYWQVFARRGQDLQVWLKAAEVDYLKPAKSHLTIDYQLDDDAIERAAAAIERDGKAVQAHSAHAIDASGECCATARCQVYLRRVEDNGR